MTLEDARIVLSTLGKEETLRVSTFKLRLTEAIDGVLEASKKDGTDLDHRLVDLTNWLIETGIGVEMPEVGTDLIAAAMLLRAARDRALVDQPIYEKKVKEMTQAAVRVGAPFDAAPPFDPDQFGSSKGMRMAGKARLQEVGFQVECALRLADFKAAPPRLTLLRPTE